MKTILDGILILIFIPLVLAFFFLMPVEFLVATWQLTQVTAKTSGVVTRSEVERNSNNSRSVVEFTYRVHGHEHSSTRLRAGLLSNRGYEKDGGDFSRLHPAGTKVTVHYDPRHPAFAILEFGWPKWSVGFSLGVWGSVIGKRLRASEIIRRSQAVGYAFARATAVTGILTIVVMGPTLTPSDMLTVAAFYAGTVVVVLAYASVKFARNSGSKDTQADSAPKPAGDSKNVEGPEPPG